MRIFEVLQDVLVVIEAICLLVFALAIRQKTTICVITYLVFTLCCFLVSVLEAFVV